MGKRLVLVILIALTIGASVTAGTISGWLTTMKNDQNYYDNIKVLTFSKAEYTLHCADNAYSSDADITTKPPATVVKPYLSKDEVCDEGKFGGYLDKHLVTGWKAYYQVYSGAVYGWMVGLFVAFLIGVYGVRLSKWIVYGKQGKIE